MNHQSSNVTVVLPVPVSVSIVVICDIRVLVGRNGDCWYFPYRYVNSVNEDIQKVASQILSWCVYAEQNYEKWLPVDIRTGARKNIDGVSTLDIGYMTILDSLDLPEVRSKELQWMVVNLDDKKFPAKLCMDHNLLWESSIEMLSLIK